MRRLIAAGFVPVGRTNMTEFAFSGLGINPHYGTPRGPWDRRGTDHGVPGGHIPGGSSSGAAVSVADGMACAAIGTDTGGSCRIPAACCGIVGVKPTARRVPLDGVLPLSSTLDSAGPLANSVACCAIVDAVIAGEHPDPPAPAALAGLRLAVPTNIVLEGMDATVGAAFERALQRLASHGVRIEHRAFPALDDIPRANATGGFSIAESYAWHRALLAEKAALYDPRVRSRIERGGAMSAADYITLIAARAAIIRAMQAATAPFDAIAMPTIPIVPPLIAELHDDDSYTRTNQLLLRNPSIANFLDRCAISLPCHIEGTAPVGLTLMGETMADRPLFAIAAAVEAVMR